MRWILCGTPKRKALPKTTLSASGPKKATKRVKATAGRHPSEANSLANESSLSTDSPQVPACGEEQARYSKTASACQEARGNNHRRAGIAPDLPAHSLLQTQGALRSACTPHGNSGAGACLREEVMRDERNMRSRV